MPEGARCAFDNPSCPCYLVRIMKKLLVLLLLASSVCAQDRPRSRRHPASASAKEAAAQQMNAMVKAWNDADVAAYTKDFADETDFIDAAGAVYKSRQEFQRHLEGLFRSPYKGAHQEMALRRIYFVRPRVAIADLDLTITKVRSAPPGVSVNPGQPIHMRLRYVLSAETKHWVVVSGQETQTRSK